MRTRVRALSGRGRHKGSPHSVSTDLKTLEWTMGASTTTAPSTEHSRRHLSTALLRSRAALQ
eukprot:5139382-Alexandrium_andersonii.AAC.1